MSAQLNQASSGMYVIKRDGRRQEVHFDKIKARIKRLCYGLSSSVEYDAVAQSVIKGVHKGVTTSELDVLAAETAANKSADYPDYAILAGRLAVANLHQNIAHIQHPGGRKISFLHSLKALYEYQETKTGLDASLIAKNVYAFIMEYPDKFENSVLKDRDSRYDFFGFKTLERSYLLKIDGKIVETPQFMLMRVTAGMHAPAQSRRDDRAKTINRLQQVDTLLFGEPTNVRLLNEKNECSVILAAMALEWENALKDTIESYDAMSQGWFTHASPTLFNGTQIYPCIAFTKVTCGTPRPQLSSCFLLTMKEDSIEGIYDTLKQCAMISKQAGGIGLAISSIRATDSYIRGTNGVSNGLVPMLRVYNNTAKYVDQGGGKRKGAFAVYLEPWHADIFAFLDLKKNQGEQEQRCRDLFLGLWIPDLFMRRVESDGNWSLMCPHECPGLQDNWGEKFEKIYLDHEKRGKMRKTIKARDLWFAILDAQTETGVPYMCFKDACNRKSNQQNLGTIRSSNLCSEILEYTAPDEVAVCNLASIALPMFLEDGKFNYKKLFDVTAMITRNLNKIIDINYYPIVEAKNSNLRHRPIGIGIQGLADLFIMLRLPYDSPGARRLNKDVLETMYFAALTASKDLAKKDGPYSSYEGSPVSKGILQFDMWGVTPDSGRWDWAGLKAEIKAHGVRNSLLLAPMPTATTSQILGNNESHEPYTSNLYVRRTLAGEFICVSRHLLADLLKLGIWNPLMKNKLIQNNGSVQKIREIPQEIKDIYRTVWEIPQKAIIDMAADRGAYIDQSQSLNIHMQDVNYAKLTSMFFHAWAKGIKTLYYLRTKPATDAIKFTMDAEMLRIETEKQEKADEELARMSSLKPAHFSHFSSQVAGMPEEKTRFITTVGVESEKFGGNIIVAAAAYDTQMEGVHGMPDGQFASWSSSGSPANVASKILVQAESMMPPHIEDEPDSEDDEKDATTIIAPPKEEEPSAELLAFRAKMKAARERAEQNDGDCCGS